MNALSDQNQITLYQGDIFCTRLQCMHQKLKYVILWTNASRDHKHFFIDICQLSSEIFILVKNLLQKNIFPAGIFPKFYRKNVQIPIGS